MMNTHIRKEILELLLPLPAMQTEKGRRALLLSAGLDAILSHADLDGNISEVVPLLVNALEHFGSTESGNLALVLFLQAVAEQVGLEKQAAIQTLCEQIIRDAKDKTSRTFRHLTVYDDLRPLERGHPARLERGHPVRILSDELGPNPYKGLSAFQETDANRFFGRERVIQTLWDEFRALHERPLDAPAPLRLLAILGPSGSGKSSVARAGLLPKLAAHPLPGTQRARVAVFTPGTRPIQTLATILARMVTDDPAPVAKSREFAEELWKTPPRPPQGGNSFDGMAHYSPFEGGRGVFFPPGRG